MRLLFVRFSSLGDIILTTGVIKYFKEKFPEAQIDVLTYSQFKSVFDDLPFIDRVICHERGGSLKSYLGLVQKEINDYDYVIDLHGKFLSMIIRFSSTSTYLRYRKDSADRRRFVKNHKLTDRLSLHVTQKYFEPLAHEFGLDMPEIEQLRPVLSSQADVIKGNILIHPFASRYTKTYPYVKELAEILINYGFTPVFAGDGDAPYVKGAIYKTGKTSLTELFDTVQSCEAVISTDSGPMHIAAALNKPTIAIFGSTTRQFGFFPLFSGVKIIEDDSVDCRPCDVHGKDACPKGHFNCMKNLKPEMIAQELKDLIRR